MHKCAVYEQQQLVAADRQTADLLPSMPLLLEAKHMTIILHPVFIDLSLSSSFAKLICPRYIFIMCYCLAICLNCSTQLSLIYSFRNHWMVLFGTFKSNTKMPISKEGNYLMIKIMYIYSVYLDM